MIKVLIPLNSEFKLYEKELKTLYEVCQDKICDPNSFDFIVNETLFYCFVEDKSIIGVIYFFKEGEKLYLNAFGRR